MIHDRLNAYIEEPEEVESGDGLPPLDVTNSDRDAWGPELPSGSLVGSFRCRERQLKASLLREKELRELLQDILDGYSDTLSVSDLIAIKAAVKGE